MNLISNLTDEPNQLVNITLENGDIVSLNFIYRPRIQRWQLNITYGDFVINNINLCIHPNLLRQWRNVIDLGIAIVSNDGVDPIYIDDFVNERIEVYTLNSTDISYVESTVIPA